MSNIIEQDIIFKKTLQYISDAYTLAVNLKYPKDFTDAMIYYYKNLTKENAQQTYDAVHLLSCSVHSEVSAEDRTMCLKAVAVCVGVAAVSYGVNTVVKYYNSTTNRFTRLLNGLNFCSKVGTAFGLCGGVFFGICWFTMGAKN